MDVFLRLLTLIAIVLMCLTSIAFWKSRHLIGKPFAGLMLVIALLSGSFSIIVLGYFIPLMLASQH